MIPRAHIIAWRQHAPWADNDQVEQDLVISRCLVDIYADDLLSDELAFRGGTAFHKLALERPARYSEDIDLVQLRATPIGPVLDRLRAVLGAVLGEPRVSQRPNAARQSYRFESEFLPASRLRVKVEIQTREHFSVFSLQRRTFEVDNPWFEGSSELVTYEVDELMGTKLRALYQRRNGRDLFDLWVALDNDLIEPGRVVECFTAYVERQGLRITRTEFEDNLSAKMTTEAFLEDIDPLLRPGIVYSPSEAYARVMDELVSRLDS